MKKNLSATIATVVVAVLAVVAAIFAFSRLNADDNNPTASTEATTTAPPVYQADETKLDEMKDAATTLLSNNYTILKLYYTKGVAHEDEPYGNRPEDGYYTAADSKYKTLSDIETIVDATFDADTAQQLKDTRVYADKNGVLGINADFAAESYDISWTNPTFVVKAVSETTGEVTLTLHDKDGGEVVKTAAITFDGEKWLLTDLVR